MIKVKFFQGNTTNYDKLEKDINEWLFEHNDFVILDIKFQKDTGDREAMIIYIDDESFENKQTKKNLYSTPIDHKGNVNDIHKFFEEDIEINEFMSSYPTTGGKKNG